MVQITSVDLLKRRNKRGEKCTAHWDRYDDLVLESHIQNVGCRATYISRFTNFPYAIHKMESEGQKRFG